MASKSLSMAEKDWGSLGGGVDEEAMMGTGLG